MREVIDKSPRSVTTINRDEHEKNGRYVFQQQIYNDDIIDHNQRIRLEGVIPKGKLNPYGEGRINHSFQMSPEEWAIFRRDYKDIIKGLGSRDEDERNKAARQMKILKPEWSTTEGFW